MKKLMQFTVAQLAEFVLAQPDDKPLDMMQSMMHEKCGCVLIQFAKDHKFPVSDPLLAGAGWCSIQDHSTELFFSDGEILEKSELNDNVNTFTQGLFERHVQTFGQAKKYLHLLKYPLT